MNTISINKFRDNIKNFVEKVVTEHIPLKVTRRNNDDFIVISADDRDREQETLYVLQNSDLIKQITLSSASHLSNKGYIPTIRERNEITGI